MQNPQVRTITVGGESYPYREQSLDSLLSDFVKDAERDGVAVAVNGEVVARTEWKVRLVLPGDRVEVIHAVAGG